MVASPRTERPSSAVVAEASRTSASTGAPSSGPPGSTATVVLVTASLAVVSPASVPSASDEPLDPLAAVVGVSASPRGSSPVTASPPSSPQAAASSADAASTPAIRNRNILDSLGWHTLGWRTPVPPTLQTHAGRVGDPRSPGMRACADCSQASRGRGVVIPLTFAALTGRPGPVGGQGRPARGQPDDRLTGARQQTLESARRDGGGLSGGAGNDDLHAPTRPSRAIPEGGAGLHRRRGPPGRRRSSHGPGSRHRGALGRRPRLGPDARAGSRR